MIASLKLLINFQIFREVNDPKLSLYELRNFGDSDDEESYCLVKSVETDADEKIDYHFTTDPPRSNSNFIAIALVVGIVAIFVFPMFFGDDTADA